MKSLAQHIDESFEEINEEFDTLNEGKVESESDFRNYAEKKLKAAFGDKYDDDKAQKTINGIVKKADGDWESAIGMIVSGLKEDGDITEE